MCQPLFSNEDCAVTQIVERCSAVLWSLFYSCSLLEGLCCSILIFQILQMCFIGFRSCPGHIYFSFIIYRKSLVFASMIWIATRLEYFTFAELHHLGGLSFQTLFLFIHIIYIAKYKCYLPPLCLTAGVMHLLY